MSTQAERHYRDGLCNDLTSPCALLANSQYDNYCSTMRIALPLASTGWLVQANVDSKEGLQEVRQMDQAQAQGLKLLQCCCSAVVVMQQGVVLTLEEVKVKEDAQHEALQPAQ